MEFKQNRGEAGFNKVFCFPLVLGIILLIHSNALVIAQQNPDSSGFGPVHGKVELGPEYMWPSSNIHTIKTVSLNFFFWKPSFKKIKLRSEERRVGKECRL